MSVYKEPVEWMRQSIDSILNQTFTDFEFIIVNDNPERVENARLLDWYTQRDGRIKVITNGQNIGLTKSLNKCLEIARGEYIARMDADDISLPERFDLQIKFMDDNPNVIASGGAVHFINEDGTVTGSKKYETRPDKIKGKLLWESCIVHPAAIIRNISGLRYNENYRCSQDYELWTRLVLLGDLSNIKNSILNYRVSSAQISSNRIAEQAECGLRATMDYAKSIHYNLEADDISTVQLLSVKKSNISHTAFRSLLYRLHDNNRNNQYIDLQSSFTYLLGLYADVLSGKENLFSAFANVIVTCTHLHRNPTALVFLILKKYILKQHNHKK